MTEIQLKHFLSIYNKVYFLKNYEEYIKIHTFNYISKDIQEIMNNLLFKYNIDKYYEDIFLLFNHKFLKTRTTNQIEKLIIESIKYSINKINKIINILKIKDIDYKSIDIIKNNSKQYINIQIINQ